MRHGSFAATVSAAFLVTSLLMAPAAAATSRNSGIGPEIADQGNRALQVIRAELQQTKLRLARPELPHAEFAKLAATASGGATSVGATAVRCAK